MCQEPCNVPGVGLVACRFCWQCKANRVNDYVGRCIAEQLHSTKTLAVTLTYGGGDVVNSATLVYSDVQKMLKRLRKCGFKVRYIVAGEYGSKKGRAHWHAILFFQGKVPTVPLDTRINWVEGNTQIWPHGYSYFQTPDYGGFAYVLKYILKYQDQETAVGHFAMSKKPLLGYSWIVSEARRYAEAGLAPQDFGYSFRDVVKKNGKRHKFWLQGRARELFLEHYIAACDDLGKEPKPSDIVTEFQDKVIRDSRIYTVEELQAQIEEWKFLRPVDEDEKEMAWQRHDLAYRSKIALAYHVLPGTDYLIIDYGAGEFGITGKDENEWDVYGEKQVEVALRGLGLEHHQRKQVLRKLFPNSSDADGQPPLCNPSKSPTGSGGKGKILTLQG